MSNWNSNQENKDNKQTHQEPFVGNIDDLEQKNQTQGETDQAHTKPDSTTQKAFEQLSAKPNWEHKILEQLAFAHLREQRAKRRWGIFFKLLIFIYLFGLTGLLWYQGEADIDGISGEHTALIDIEGIIAADQAASADHIVSALRDAFKDKNTKGIILRMNTPGGSPVQAGYINDEIYRLKKKYPDKPVYAVISDICASGGYYIAAAADAIYADKASIVGSIGVIMNGFGFVEAMRKLGISRRVYTAGKHKAFLDPFSPENTEEVTHIKETLKEIHQQFITAVKKGRGDKLTDDPNLFSGFFWSGQKAMQMGLVDKLGSASYVAREVIGAEKIKDFTYQQDWLERFSQKAGVTMAQAVLSLESQDRVVELR